MALIGTLLHSNLLQL